MTKDEVIAAVAAKDKRYIGFMEKKSAKTLACTHRSPEPVNEVQCKTCMGRRMMKIYGCDLYGTCAIGAVDGQRSCMTCNDRTG